MYWERLVTPLLSVLTFVGCVAYLGLFRSFQKALWQKPALCLLVMEATVLGICHLILQSTFLSLKFLELWTPQDEIGCVALSYVNNLFRTSVILISICLLGERYLAVRKPNVHSRFVSFQIGLALSVGAISITVLFTTLFLFFGVIGCHCEPQSLGGDIVPWASECALAVSCLLLTMGCKWKHRCRSRVDYQEQRSIVSQNVNPIFRYTLTLSLSTLIVCVLQLISSRRRMELSPNSAGTLEIWSAIIENVSFALLPITLLSGKQSVGVCITPGWLHQPETTGNQSKRRSGEISRPTCRSGRQQADAQTSTSRLSSQTQTEVPKRFRQGQRVSVRKISQFSSWTSSSFPTARRLDVSCHSEGTSATVSTNSIHQPRSIQKSKKLSSLAPTPLTIQLESIVSSEMDFILTTNSVVVTSPSFRLSNNEGVEAFVFPLRSTQCWYEVDKARSGNVSLISAADSLSESSGRMFQISPRLKGDYIRVTGNLPIEGAAFPDNLPGFIPSPPPTGTFRLPFNDPEYLLSETTVCHRPDSNGIADVFDRFSKVYLGTLQMGE